MSVPEYYTQLPPGFNVTAYYYQSTWEILVNEHSLARAKELPYAIFFAFGWTILRLLLEFLILNPLGKFLIAREQDKYGRRVLLKGDQEQTLRAQFPKLQARLPSDTEIKTAATAAKLSPGDVANWAKRRRRFLLTVKKFRECGWQCFFYFISIGYAVWLLQRHDWRWMVDLPGHWYPWPNTHDWDIFLYYFLQLGFYLHQTVAFFFEEQRKDAVVMFTHHITTILLVVWSWCGGFTLIGAVIFFVHDISDPLLQGGKMIHYANRETFLTKAVFALFAISFGYSRLYLYPTVCIASVYFEAHKFFGPAFATWAGFLLLLVILQALHIYWYYLVLRMAVGLLLQKEWKDARSDSDVSDDEGKKRK